MKKLYTTFLTLGSAVLLLMTSCKKNDTMVVTKGGTAGALTANATTLVLDKNKLNDTSSIVKFTFTKPTYEFNAAVTNTLQIDVPGDNWGSKMVQSTFANKVYSQGYSTNDFNSLLLKLGLPGGQASQVVVRVQSSLGGASTPIYTNTLNMTVTPYFLTSWLYTVGSFQGWDINHTDSLISVTGNGVYTGIIIFPATKYDFLVVPKKGSYDNKYATNDPTTGVSSTVTQNGPNNFFAPATPGPKMVTLDLNKNTISFATPTTYYSIIGDAVVGGDWNTDNFMNLIADGGNTWTATVTLNTTGGFKIRENAAWTTSFGSLATPDGKDLTSNSGGNLSVSTAGTYRITFTPSADDKTGTYTIVKTQ